MSDGTPQTPTAPEKPPAQVGKPLPPPFKVSPVIKLFRWGLLILGIFHGASRRSHLAKKEAIYREEHLKKKAIRDLEIAEHKRQMSERDIEMLAKLLK